MFQLFDIGFKNLDAVDASAQMLEVAKNKDIYKRLICDYLGPNRLDIEDGMNFIYLITTINIRP